MSTTYAPITSPDLDDHDTIVVSLALQHELERLKASYHDRLTNHAGLLAPFRIKDAGRGVLKTLTKVSPKAAENWVKYHGQPEAWT